MACLRLMGMAVLVWLFSMPASVLWAQRSPRFDYFFLEASKCLRNRDAASAAELFSHCLEIDSTAAEALYSMSLVNMYLLGKDSLGVRMLEEACRRDSCNALYLNALGKVYLGQHDTDKVIPVLERLSRLQTHRSDVLDQLVAVYRSTGQNEKALATLGRMELMNGMSEEISVRKSDVYDDMGMPDSARAEMQRLSEAFPHEMGYRLLLAMKYLEEKRTDDARSVLEEVQQREPQYSGLPPAWLNFYRQTDMPRYLLVRDSILLDSSTADDLRCMLLDVYAREALADSAKIPQLEAVYDTLVARSDCSVNVLLSKARWLARAGEFSPQVAQVMNRVLDTDAGNEFAIRYLVGYYARQEDQNGVEDMCRRGTGFFPGKLQYPFYLAEVLVQQDKDDEARRVLTQGLQVRDADSDERMVSDAFALLGDLYHECGDAELSYAAYDSSLVYNPDNILCLNNYAYYLSLAGIRLDDAEEMSYRTVVLEPRNVIYLDTYAWILFVKEKYTEARIYMNRAADPQLSDDKLLENSYLNGNILEHAGDIHACCGDMEQALRFWNLAVGRNDGTCSKRISSKIKKRKYLK